MKQFTTLSRNPGQESRYRQLMDLLISAHGRKLSDLSQVPDLAGLKQRIIDETVQWFSPSKVEFKPLAQSSVETAARDSKRLIYIPSHGADTIFVSGENGINSLNIFEVMPAAIGLGQISLPASAGCLVVAPLVSGRGLADAPFVFRGLMLIEKTKPQAFDPAVDLPILRQMSCAMATVMAEKSLTL